MIRDLRPSFVDDDILMAIPELYRYGREGYWFSNNLFAIYMMEGVFQVCTSSFVSPSFSNAVYSLP